MRSSAFFAVRASGMPRPPAVFVPVAPAAAPRFGYGNGDSAARQSDYNQRLLAACARGELTSVRGLARLGADLNHAAEQADSGGNRYLISDTPLIVAVAQGAQGVVEFLLKPDGNRTPADPERQNQEGHTPLMIAATYNRSGCTETLLRAGAQPNQVGLFGDTALFCAVSRKAEAVIDRLLAAGASLNLRNGEQETPLHLAVKNNLPGIVQQLIHQTQTPPDLSLQTSQGNTALHLGARKLADSAFQTLLGALPPEPAAARRILGIRNQAGKTALQLAAEAKNREAVGRLLDAGAESQDPGAQPALQFLLIDQVWDATLARQRAQGPLLHAAAGSRQECEGPRGPFPTDQARAEAALHYARQLTDFSRLLRAVQDLPERLQPDAQDVALLAHYRRLIRDLIQPSGLGGPTAVPRALHRREMQPFAARASRPWQPLPPTPPRRVRRQRSRDVWRSLQAFPGRVRLWWKTRRPPAATSWFSLPASSFSSSFSSGRDASGHGPPGLSQSR